MLMPLIVLNDKASNLLWEINFRVCLKEQNQHSLRDCWTVIIRKKGQQKQWTKIIFHNEQLITRMYNSSSGLTHI